MNVYSEGIFNTSKARNSLKNNFQSSKSGGVKIKRELILKNPFQFQLNSIKLQLKLEVLRFIKRDKKFLFKGIRVAH